MPLTDIRLNHFLILILNFIELFNYVAGCYHPTIRSGRQNNPLKNKLSSTASASGKKNVCLDGCQL